MDIILPKSWAELQPQNLIDISRLFLPEIDQSTFLTKALIKLTGLIPLIREPVEDVDTWFWFQKRKDKPILISRQSLAELSNKLQFLLEPVEDVEPPAWKGANRYKCPKRRLYNLTVEQYLYAELAFMAYNKQRKDEFLYKLIACLWVPRQGLKADQLESQAEKFKKLDPAIPRAVFLFYAGARRYLASEFTHIFSTEESGAEDFDVTTLIRALNGGDITRNEGILRTQLWDALKQLEDMAIQSALTKKQMKK